MTVLDKPITDYFRFQALLLALTVALGLTRFGLSLAGQPATFLPPLVSMTGLSVIAIVYLPLRLHSKGFGGYSHLWGLLTVQLGVAGAISAAGIVFAVATGVGNAFEPDAANPGYLWHALSHFPGAPILSPLLWFPACGVLWVLRRIMKRPPAVA